MEIFVKSTAVAQCAPQQKNVHRADKNLNIGFHSKCNGSFTFFAYHDDDTTTGFVVLIQFNRGLVNNHRYNFMIHLKAALPHSMATVPLPPRVTINYGTCTKKRARAWQW